MLILLIILALFKKMYCIKNIYFIDAYGSMITSHTTQSVAILVSEILDLVSAKYFGI